MHYYDIRKADRELQVFSGHKKAVSYVKFLNANTLVSASTDSQECFMNIIFVFHTQNINIIGNKFMKHLKLKMWKCGNEQSGKTFAEASFTGHQNEKNFVGLATDGDYIACGSEDNSLYVYYKGGYCLSYISQR